jgi:hypothetical protein
VGYIDIAAVSFVLPDGRPLLDEVTFRVAASTTICTSCGWLSLRPAAVMRTNLPRALSSSIVRAPT